MGPRTYQSFRQCASDRASDNIGYGLSRNIWTPKSTEPPVQIVQNIWTPSEIFRPPVKYLDRVRSACCYPARACAKGLSNRFFPEEVVQVYGICIRTLHLPVISVMIIGVMRLSYNERAVSEGRFRHHLFQAVFVRTSYPSRYMYFRWSRVHKAVETAVTATVVM